MADTSGSTAGDDAATQAYHMSAAAGYYLAWETFGKRQLLCTPLRGEAGEDSRGWRLELERNVAHCKLNLFSDKHIDPDAVAHFLNQIKVFAVVKGSKAYEIIENAVLTLEKRVRDRKSRTTVESPNFGRYYLTKVFSMLQKSTQVDHKQTEFMGKFTAIRQQSLETGTSVIMKLTSVKQQLESAQDQVAQEFDEKTWTGRLQPSTLNARPPPLSVVPPRDLRGKDGELIEFPSGDDPILILEYQRSLVEGPKAPLEDELAQVEKKAVAAEERLEEAREQKQEAAEALEDEATENEGDGDEEDEGDAEDDSDDKRVAAEEARVRSQAVREQRKLIYEQAHLQQDLAIDVIRAASKTLKDLKQRRIDIIGELDSYRRISLALCSAQDLLQEQLDRQELEDDELEESVATDYAGRPIARDDIRCLHVDEAMFRNLLLQSLDRRYKNLLVFFRTKTLRDLLHSIQELDYLLLNEGAPGQLQAKLEMMKKLKLERDRDRRPAGLNRTRTSPSPWSSPTATGGVTGTAMRSPPPKYSPFQTPAKTKFKPKFASVNALRLAMLETGENRESLSEVALAFPPGTGFAHLAANEPDSPEEAPPKTVNALSATATGDNASSDAPAADVETPRRVRFDPEEPKTTTPANEPRSTHSAKRSTVTKAPSRTPEPHILHPSPDFLRTVGDASKGPSQLKKMRTALDELEKKHAKERDKRVQRYREAERAEVAKRKAIAKQTAKKKVKTATPTKVAASSPTTEDPGPLPDLEAVVTPISKPTTTSPRVADKFPSKASRKAGAPATAQDLQLAAEIAALEADLEADAEADADAGGNLADVGAITIFPLQQLEEDLQRLVAPSASSYTPHVDVITSGSPPGVQQDGLTYGVFNIQGEDALEQLAQRMQHCESKAEAYDLQEAYTSPAAAALVYVKGHDGHWVNATTGSDCYLGKLTVQRPDGSTAVVIVLIDTGAAVSCVRASVAQSLGISLSRSKVTIRGAGNMALACTGEGVLQGSLQLENGKLTKKTAIPMLAFDTLNFACILGKQALGDFDLVIRCKQHRVFYEPEDNAALHGPVKLVSNRDKDSRPNVDDNEFPALLSESDEFSDSDSACEKEASVAVVQRPSRKHGVKSKKGKGRGRDRGRDRARRTSASRSPARGPANRANHD